MREWDTADIFGTIPQRNTEDSEGMEKWKENENGGMIKKHGIQCGCIQKPSLSPGLHYVQFQMEWTDFRG